MQLKKSRLLLPPIFSAAAKPEKVSTATNTQDDGSLAPFSNNRTPVSLAEVLSQYDGDGNINYEQYDLSSSPELRNTLHTINAERIEFPKRALDVSLIQDYLASGDLEMAFFTANQLKNKQQTLAKIARK